jgi:hypothetical protein
MFSGNFDDPDNSTGTPMQRTPLTTNFSRNDSPAYQYIRFRFSSGITHKELLSLALVISEQKNITLSRAEKRDNTQLLVWFDFNWTQIYPVISCIRLLDKNRVEINLVRQLNEALG